MIACYFIDIDNQIDPTNPIPVNNPVVHTMPPAKVQYINQSPMNALLLSFFTAGLYDIVWFYRNWRAYKQATDENIKPFWRALFSIFFVHKLFKSIGGNVEQQDTGALEVKKVSYKGLATLYVVFSLILNALSRYPDDNLVLGILSFVLFFASSYLIYFVQKEINKQPTQNVKNSAGVIFLYVLGVLLFIGVLWAWFVPLEDDGLTLSPQQNQETTAAKAAYDRLTAEYNICSAQINAKYETLDQTSQSAVDAYNAEFDACELVRIQQNAATDEYNELSGN